MDKHWATEGRPLYQYDKNVWGLIVEDSGQHQDIDLHPDIRQIENAQAISLFKNYYLVRQMECCSVTG